MDDAFSCPHCGAPVSSTARFCRECGADDDVGWNDLPIEEGGAYDTDDDFDYDDFVGREFPDQAGPANKNPVFVIVVILLLLSMLLFLI